MERRTYQEVFRRERRRALFFLPVIALAYFTFFTAILSPVLVFVFCLKLARASGDPQGLNWVFEALFLVGAAATLIAIFQYLYARKNGPALILKYLRAYRPIENDRYHKTFVNLTEEMRISAGLPAAACWVIPSPSVNSLGLVMPDGQPTVLMSEGMLGTLTREQLQAAVAHELAHLINGDTVILTMLCSIVGFFDRLGELLTPEPETYNNAGVFATFNRGRDGGAHAGMALAFVMAMLSKISTFMMRQMMAFISRRREFMADARAVEMTRNPIGLAGAIYRASLARTHVGSLPENYGPLYIVAPGTSGLDERDSWLSSLLSTHPPIRARLKVLADMAATSVEQIVADVWRETEARERAKQTVVGQQAEAEAHANAERARATELAGEPAEELPLGPATLGAAGAATDRGLASPVVLAASPQAHRPSWLGMGIAQSLPQAAPAHAAKSAATPGAPPAPQHPPAGETDLWETPRVGAAHRHSRYSTEQLVSLPMFTLYALVRRPGTTDWLRAGDVPALRREFMRRQGGGSTPTLKEPECPRCNRALLSIDYEGAPVLKCPECRGHFVRRQQVTSILSRREKRFTPDILALAEKFRFNVGLNPEKLGGPRNLSGLSCPECRTALTHKCYSYALLLPVDECLRCEGIWFDRDELEVLQAMSERQQDARE